MVGQLGGQEGFSQPLLLHSSQKSCKRSNPEYTSYLTMHFSSPPIACIFVFKGFVNFQGLLVPWN